MQNDSNIDYLAEVIISHMIRNENITEKDVIVHLKGVFERYFSKEVANIRKRHDKEGKPLWDIFINREGMYDILPEGFFHSGSGTFFKDKNETLKDLKRHKLEEKKARIFFLPFEQEFFKMRINKEQFEQDFFYSPEAVEEFVVFFNLDNLNLNSYQKSSLFFIFPYIPHIIGNLKLTQTCFEIILQEKVKIAFSGNSKELPSDLLPCGLNQTILAKDSILGDLYTSTDPVIKITIGPLQDCKNLNEFLAGNKRNMLNRLTELFIQADIEIETDLLLDEKDQTFILGSEEKECRLNLSTTI